MKSICCPICGSPSRDDGDRCSTCGASNEEIIYTLAKSIRERKDPGYISVFGNGERISFYQVFCPNCGARTVNHSDECHACDFRIRDAISEGYSPVLSTDAPYMERRAIALDPNTSHATLAILARDAIPFVRRGVATNPNAPSEFLIEQSKCDDAAMRSAVAGNPSTPADTLVALAQDSEDIVKRQIVLNPSAPEPAKQEALSLLCQYSLEQLAKDQSSYRILDMLADSKEKQVRAAVAANAFCGRSTYEKLCSDPEECVRAAVAGNFEAPLELLESMQHDKSPIVRYELAKNPRTEIDLRESLSKQDDVILVAKRRMRGMTNSQLEDPEVIRNHFFSRANESRALADSPNTPEETIRYLAESKDGPTRRLLLKNPATPVDVVCRIIVETKNNCALADTSYFESVVIDAADREDVDEKTLSLFISSGFRRVQEAVVDDPRIAAKDLESLSCSESVSIRSKVARSAKATVAILERLAFDSSEDVRQSVLWNPWAPRDLVNSILCDSDSQIAKLLKARNPEIGAEELERLCTRPTHDFGDTDANHAVRIEVAQNVSAPARLLEALANDSYREVRDAVVRNPSVPERIARIAEANEAPTPMKGRERFNRVLETFEDIDDLMWRGGNSLDEQHDYTFMSDTDYDFLYELSGKYKKHLFREKCARSEETPAFICERISTDTNVRAREKLASNRCIATHVQLRLAFDESVSVRRSLVDNEFVTPGVLDILSYDIDNRVRTLALRKLRKLFP